MIVGDVPRGEFVTRIGHPGISLDTGPFVVRLQTAIEDLAEEVRFLYAQFPVDPDGGITDFHVSLRRPSGLRRWVRPQVFFLFDGAMFFEPLPLRVAIPLFEWSLNWCAASQPQHYLMIHSAALERNGRGILFPGAPGAGKSTLCAALAHRGWRLLSDEFGLLRLGDAQLVPWPRPISLKGSSIDLIRTFAPDARVGRTTLDTVKGPVAHVCPPAGSVARAAEMASPRWVVFPAYEAGAPARLTPLSRARAFFRLAEYSFNYETLGPPGFETLSALIDRCETYEFRYGALDEALAVFNSLALPDGGAPGA